MALSPPRVTDVSLSGHRPEAVVELLLSRARGGPRDDGNRLALVVEGGAMCGVYTAATLLALHALGLSDAFDDVYGTSAGAVNAAHFLSGRGEHKVDTYYRCLTDGRFLKLSRLHKVVDIDYFVHEVLTRLRPVETERVLESRSRFWVGVGDYAAATSRILRAERSSFPLLQIIKAAVAMPVVYNRRVRLGDLDAFDAGFFNPFPLVEALRDGPSHVLVLVARSCEHRSEPTKLWQRALFAAAFARSSPDLRRLYAGSPRVSDHLRDLAHGRIALPAPFAGASVATLAPERASVRRTTQDPELLRSELLRVARGALELLHGPVEPLEEWIAAGHV